MTLNLGQEAFRVFCAKSVGQFLVNLIVSLQNKNNVFLDYLLFKKSKNINVYNSLINKQTQKHVYSSQYNVTDNYFPEQQYRSFNLKTFSFEINLTNVDI